MGSRESQNSGQEFTGYITVPQSKPDRFNLAVHSTIGGGYVCKQKADTEFYFRERQRSVDQPQTRNLLQAPPLYYDGYREMNLVLEFKRDRKGNVTSFEISLSRAERIPFTKVTENR